MLKNVRVFISIAQHFAFPRFVACSKFQARGKDVVRPTHHGNAEGRIVVYGSLAVLAVATLQCCLFFFEACGWSKALDFLLLDLHRISFDTFFFCVYFIVARVPCASSNCDWKGPLFQSVIGNHTLVISINTLCGLISWQLCTSNNLFASIEPWSENIGRLDIFVVTMV